MKRFKSSFFAKLFISYFLVAIIPLLLITALLYGFSEKIFRNNIEEESNRYIQEVRTDLEGLYSYYEQAVDLLSKDPLTLQVLEEQKISEEDTRIIYEKMYYLFSGRSTKASLYILGMDGVVLFSSDMVPSMYDTKSYLSWGVLRKATSSPMKVVFHNASQKEMDTQNKVLTGAMGIEINDNLQGYILVDIKREEFSNIIFPKTQGNIWEALIMNEMGNVLYSKNRRIEEGRSFPLESGYKPYDLEGQYTAKKADSTFHATYGSSIKYPFRVLSYASLEDVKSNSSYLLQIMLYIGILTMVISLLVAFRVSKSLSGPVKDLVQYMKKIEKGDFSERFPIERTDEIGELMVRYNKMAKRLDLLIKNIIESKDRLKKSEMKMLQSQINPHFLYNTLDTVKWMAKMGRVEEVSALITNLGTLLRISMEDAEEFQTVEMSLSWMESYLAIQKARYDDDLTYIIEVEESILGEMIPKLILQPLVENAIFHGLEGKGTVLIKGYRNEDRLIFEVQDNGSGMDESLQYELLEETSDKGIGLKNVHRRIELLYGSGFGLKIFSKHDEGTLVRIVIPEGGRL